MRFILLLIFTPLLLTAQQQKIICKHINTHNGLMYGTINKMAQDSNGFIWIAGEEGLQRYDGYSFTDYFHNPHQPNNTIPQGKLMSLAIDEKNRLWLGSFSDGFGLFDPYYNKAKNYRYSLQSNLTKGSIGFRDFLFVNNSTFAAGTDGLVKLVSDSFKKNITPSNSALQGGLTGHIEKDKNGNFWIGTVSGLNFLSADEKHLYNHTNNKSITAFSSNVLNDNIGNKSAICQLFIDAKNNLWISTWQPGLYRYNIDSNRLQKIDLHQQNKYVFDNIVFAFEQDNEGNIWLGTSNNGLYKFNYNNSSFSHYKHDANDAQSLATNAVTALLKDKNGNILVAGKNVISIFNPSWNLISTLIEKKPLAVTAAMVAADKTLWAADIEWLYHFTPKLSLISKYHHQKNTSSTTFFGNVWGLKESANGKEIFIRREDGISIFNKESNTVDDYRDIKLLANNPVTDVIELADGNFYLCRWWWSSNLVFVNRKKRTAIEIAVSDTKEYNGYEICGTIKKDSNNWYLLSKNGLMLLNTITGKVVMNDSNFKSGTAVLFNNKFYSVTSSDGLKVYDIATKKIQSIGKYDGIPSNATKSIVHEGNGIFWIATSSGLVKWNSSNNSFTRFAEEEGIDNTEISGSTLCAAANGKIVFGNGNLYALNTALIANKCPSKPIITSCLAGDSILTPAQLNNKINISYNNNILQVKFASIHNGNSKINYQYMLEGYDEDWKDGSLRFVNFTNLPYGNFTFKVRVAGDNGVWSKDVTSLQLHVSQAFYKAWWFYAGIALIVITTIFFYYRSRINRILELQKLRNTISRDLHDEVGSTLSSISILSASVVNNLEREPVKAKEWIQQIGLYAQHMLNVMDDIVWSINPSMDDFENVVVRMREFAYALTEAADIQLNFDYEKTLSKTALPMLYKRNLYLIFKEAVNNAIKHAACTQITVQLYKQNNNISLVIKDNGKGFDSKKQVNRNGIKNIQNRAEEMGSKIQIQSTANGTEIFMFIGL